MMADTQAAGEAPVPEGERAAITAAVIPLLAALWLFNRKAY